MFCSREVGFLFSVCKSSPLIRANCMRSLCTRIPQSTAVDPERERYSIFLLEDHASALRSGCSISFASALRGYQRKNGIDDTLWSGNAACYRAVRGVRVSTLKGVGFCGPGEQDVAECPLCEKLPRFEAALGDVLKWRERARGRASEVGREFLDRDGGPDANELLRELEWMLDDAVAGLKCHAAAALLSNTDGTHASWVPYSWKQLWTDATRHRGLKDDKTLDWKVMMRASLIDMEEMLRCRIEQRVPFQYLVGASHWRDMVLAVQPGVLIPRPETELLIEMVEGALARAPHLGKGPWADMGTGSGAIAIALARFLPDSEVLAVDKSPVAIAVASANAERLGVASRVRALRSDWFSSLGGAKLAGIVSNPPYIPSTDLPSLQAEVGKHEPWLALDGGPGDGLESIHTLCRGAAAHLQPGGFLAIETNGGGQAELTAKLLSELHFVGEGDGSIQRIASCDDLRERRKCNAEGEMGARECFKDIEVVNDLSSISRFVSATRC